MITDKDRFCLRTQVLIGERGHSFGGLTPAAGEAAAFPGGISQNRGRTDTGARASLGSCRSFKQTIRPTRTRAVRTVGGSQLSW